MALVSGASWQAHFRSLLRLGERIVCPLCNFARFCFRLTAPSTAKAGAWYERPTPPNVIHIRSAPHFVDVLGGSGDQLVVVDVFAPWCRACRALYPKVEWRWLARFVGLGREWWAHARAPTVSESLE